MLCYEKRSNDLNSTDSSLWTVYILMSYLVYGIFVQLCYFQPPRVYVSLFLSSVLKDFIHDIKNTDLNTWTPLWSSITF